MKKAGLVFRSGFGSRFSLTPTLFFLALLGLMLGPSQAARLKVIAGPEALLHRSLTVTDTVFEGTPYLAIDILDSLFGISGQWVPDRQKWVLREDKKNGEKNREKDRKNMSWVFTLDNAFCAVGNDIYNLTYPMRRSAERLYLPLYPILRILREYQGLEISPEGLSADLITADQAAPTSTPSWSAAGSKNSSGSLLESVRCEAKSNGTLVEIGMSGFADPEILWVPPNYLARFPGARLGPGVKSRHAGTGLVQAIVLTADRDQVQVTLQLRGNVDTVEVESLPGQAGMRFLVRKAMADPAQPKTQIKDPPGKKGLGPGKGTIIVDPGHGGKDKGAIVAGVYEADITLAIGKKLKGELEKLGYKALLSREDDKFIPLQDRPKFASEKGGDVFISLHCNSMEGTRKRKQQVSGFSAYILRAGASDEDNALARRENEAILEEKGKANKAEISPVDWILLEHQLNLYSKESEALAEKIVTTLDGLQIPKYSTGAGQAGFFVLVGAYMPAVLFEMGFLTHDKDRAFLSSKKGQSQIARKLAEAIDKFMVYRAEG